MENGGKGDTRGSLCVEWFLVSVSTWPCPVPRQHGISCLLAFLTVFLAVRLCSVCVHRALSAHKWSGDHRSHKPATGTGEDLSAGSWCQTTNDRVLHALVLNLDGQYVCQCLITDHQPARPASGARLGSSCSSLTPSGHQTRQIPTAPRNRDQSKPPSALRNRCHSSVLSSETRIC